MKVLTLILAVIALLDTAAIGICMRFESMTEDEEAWDT